MVISSGLTVHKFIKFDQQSLTIWYTFQCRTIFTFACYLKYQRHARSVVLNLFRLVTHFSASDYNFSDTIRNEISQCLCLSDKVMIFFLRNENKKLFGDTMAKSSRHKCVVIHCFRTTVLDSYCGYIYI